MQELSLDSSVDCLDGIGPKRATLLATLGIHTLYDLLFHLPRRYEDRRAISPIKDAREGDTVTIQGEVVRSRLIRMRRNMSMAEVVFKDDGGEIKATWFGRGFLARSFVKGSRAFLTGTVGNYKGLCLKNPDYEFIRDDDEDLLNSGRIVPMYPLAEKVSQAMLRRWIHTALNMVDASLPETLPPSLLKARGFPPINEALRSIHLPAAIEDPVLARKRFAYEELLAIQLAVLSSRATAGPVENAIRHTTSGKHLASLGKALPFDLTAPQKRTVDEVLVDMESPRPMARLLQGDVGSGKTVVALHALAAAIDGGYQAALMAPTEILAEQHYLSLSPLLHEMGLTALLLTGSSRGAKALRSDIAQGLTQVVIGTHSLIQDATQFQNLGLVIVDEQHRFGVLQRTALSNKGAATDVLHMTATPIPRTLAMTLYGGMDISVIDELPPGRRPIETRHVQPGELKRMHNVVIEESKAGFQTFYICPLVEESEHRDLKAVTTHFAELAVDVYSSLRCAVIHGRLPIDEKESIMGQFKEGNIDVLFSTTVIEVGIDVPTATIIVIEDAAQFGLTQLHQLRGRVGRGTRQSQCFLLGKPQTDDGKKRLDIMCRTNDGFEIAEEDMKLRGPGEFQGLRQAGLTDLRVADLLADARLLDQARRDALEILKDDPHLKTPANRPLAKAAKKFPALRH